MTTPMQQAALTRLVEVERIVESVSRSADRCKRLVQVGLAADANGLPSHEVIAQYAALMAMNGSLLIKQADALAKSMRDLKWPKVENET